MTNIRFFYRHRAGLAFRQIQPTEANWLLEQMEENPAAFPDGACVAEDRSAEFSSPTLNP